MTDLVSRLEFNPSDDPDYDQFVDIYVDESSQTGHRYLLFGALMVPTGSVDAFEQSVRDARVPELPRNEMGWKNVSKAKVAAYYRVVDLFFNNPTGIKKPFDFHCVFFDTRRTDDKTYSQGSREIGFSKERYELVMRCAGMHKKNLFHLYPDDRGKAPDEAKQEALTLKIILNNSLAKEKDSRVDPFRRVQFLNSKATICLQVADILTGAIAYELNEHIKAEEASEFRVALCRYIVRDRKRLGIIGNIIDGTPTWGRYTVRPIHR